MGIRQAAIHVAPRLKHQRLVRIYFFPWILLVCALLLVAISLHIGTNLTHILVIWFILTIIFILKDLTSPQSLITRYYYHFGLRLGFDVREGINLQEKTIVYYGHQDPPLFSHRGYLRWGLYLLLLLVLSIYAIYQSANPAQATGTERAVATFLILFYSLLIFSRFVSTPVDLSWTYRIVVWTVVVIWSAGTIVFCLLHFQVDTPLVIGAGIVVFFILLSLFTAQRLWADSFILKQILDKLARDLLTWPQTHHSLNGAAARIGVELRYDRVFILSAIEKDGRLVIQDQYGVQTSIFGQEIPLEHSICGRALQDRQPVLWNDVNICPYFYRLTADDTAAEIAVPIMHQDTVYGVLDVQSIEANAFGPTNLTSLETIAQSLGTALAASRSSTFFDDALTLWQQIDEVMSAPFSSEEEAFELFADFARDRLHADQVIYFPLSLADCPTREPYTRGEFNSRAPLQPPGNDPTSSLVCLVKKWQPYFEEVVTEDSVVGRSTTTNGPGFVAREKIQSTCFLPVGLRAERLGALFLNYRQPRQFDKAFQFTCLSLAQALAKATAQVRYRDILYKGFGRPEISLHNILGRHGLKEGVLQRAGVLWSNGHLDCNLSINECALYPVFQSMEGFLTEISLAESSTPPNFWQENLESRLRTYSSSLPNQENGRRPQIDLKIDPRIERESPWVKLAFYRLTTEAVNNAILHGKATQIRITIWRAADTMGVTVENNGLSLPPAARKSASSHGIFRLLADIEEKFGAEIATIQNDEDGHGVTAMVALPALPLVTLLC